MCYCEVITLQPSESRLVPGLRPAPVRKPQSGTGCQDPCGLCVGLSLRHQQGHSPTSHHLLTRLRQGHLLQSQFEAVSTDLTSDRHL